MKINSNEYDTVLLKLEHYRLHKQMLPFIGEDYNKHRILVISESHFVKEDNQLDDDWYNRLPTKDEMENTCSREIIRVSKHNLFVNINSALKKYNCELDINSIAWYNYFQKPTRTMNSIKPTKLDLKIAADTFYSFLDIIKPKIVIFATPKAYFSAKKDERFVTCGYIIKSSSHPNSQWWNKKSKSYGNMSGKEVFISHLNSLK